MLQRSNMGLIPAKFGFKSLQILTEAKEIYLKYDAILITKISQGC